MSSSKLPQRLLCILLVLLTVPLYSFQAPDPPSTHRQEVLNYSIEWRMIRAGTARVEWNHGGNARSQINVHVESVGLVSKLFRVNDNYSSNYEDDFCSVGSLFRVEEGSRRRETRINYDRAAGRSEYVERDLAKNSTTVKHLDVPRCVQDVVGGLYRLRTLNTEPGQSLQLPVSNGKKSISARVEAQAKEELKLPSGTFRTVRYEAGLFNGQLWDRKGSISIWLTDDARRLPVQIRIRMQFHIGTIMLLLEKEEGS
ncbi:MAG: DUF3108 domain-containing protein [Bryobacterales bacterium]|nr:DUF3108 domain-containing protein [Bryobacterales bacterium]